MYLALYRKWRPARFSDVIGQRHVTDVLTGQMSSGRLSHAYLFTGSRGTGKTTCAKILARAVNCLSPRGGDPCNACPACLGILDGSATDVLEIDAASNRGIDSIRSLREEWSYTPAALTRRVYIIDEVHMLTVDAFNALLKTLEEPPPHILFILATTEPHKVPATISSRCQCFSFKRIPADTISSHIAKVAAAEGISLTPDAAALIATAADGALRDALSLLDQCSVAADVIDSAVVRRARGLSGADQLTELATAIASGDLLTALTVFSGMYADGRDIASLLDELCSLLRDLMLRSLSVDIPPLCGLDGSTLDRLTEAFGSRRRLIYCAGRAQEAIGRLVRSANRRVDAELCIAEMCDASLPLTTQSLAARIESLERGIAAGAPARAFAPPPAPKPAAAPVASRPVVSAPAKTSIDAPPWDDSAAPVASQTFNPEAPTPAQADDAPPWDTDTPESNPQNEASPSSAGAPDLTPDADAPPDREPPSEPAAQTDAADATSPAEPAEFWPDVLGAIAAELPRSVYAHLSLCTAEISGERLRIACHGEMSLSMLLDKGLEQRIGEICAGMGHNLTVYIEDGDSAPAKAPTALDRFIEHTKGKITIK